MNVNQLLNMVIRMVVRRGVNHGIEYAARRGKRPEDMSAEERQSSANISKNARQAGRLVRQARRITRL